ncbi:M3 family metallopeptidase [Gallaecimonas mangrovi]|uniref:M3 family metallopeptidase n=1 Tax=Gallaecimonas mangrovi TaxID=2291597 RepID=UPI000E1FDDB3|nr:M3 family metallopeptidase [Gallaecimonas mangrovi]
MQKTLLALTIAATLATGACSDQNSEKNGAAPKAEQTASAQSSNPLFTTSTLQYQAPEFDKISLDDYVPAFEKGMQEQLAEINAIANNTEAATFDNTIVAMEKSGAILSRTASTFFNLTGTISNEKIRAIQSQMAPKLSAHSDNINLNPKLFARVETVYNNRDSLQGEDKRLVEVYYKRFVRAGAKLDDTQKAKVRELNGEMAKLTNDFAQNVLKATKDAAIVVDDKSELAGLSDADIAGLAAAAKDAGMDGKYLINLVNTSRQPIMTSLDNRALREKIWKASTGRALDLNGPVVKLLTELRAEKAKLMGFDTWADYVLDNQMAKTPAAAFKMLDDLAPKIVAKTKQEASQIQAEIKAAGGDFELQPWDWTYYAEKVRTSKYDLDQSQVKPYFELNNVMQNGLFFTMQNLFGITLKERHDLPVYHPDVRTFEVFDHDGSSIGFFYADYFARDGKRGGAWMNAMVSQSTLLGQKPVIVNVLNIPKPAAGQPALLTFDETSTMFHEFGHALHGLFSKVKYPSLAGTSVPRDFVEFPSQFEEDWAINPKVLANYAKHYQTGEAIPAELLQKLLASRKFNQGFDSLEYVEAALLDMEWHSFKAGTDTGDVMAFEDKALEKHGVKMAVVPPRYKSPYFSHTFAGGYSAGYYAYLWTEVFAADAFAYMKENGGLTRENGDKFREAILSKGNSIDPMQQYINFRGAKPTVDALLKRRGLVD